MAVCEVDRCRHQDALFSVHVRIWYAVLRPMCDYSYKLAALVSSFMCVCLRVSCDVVLCGERAWLRCSGLQQHDMCMFDPGGLFMRHVCNYVCALFLLPFSPSFSIHTFMATSL